MFRVRLITSSGYVASPSPEPNNLITTHRGRRGRKFVKPAQLEVAFDRAWNERQLVKLL